MNESIENYRCTCGKLLFRGLILSGEIEVKCRSCKKIVTIASFSGSVGDTESYTLIINKDGAVLQFSPSAPTILGYESEELLEKNIQDLIVMLSPEFYPSLWEALTHEGPTIFLFQSFQRQKDQSMTPVEIEAQSLYSNDTRVVFAVRKKHSACLTDSMVGNMGVDN